MTARLAHSGDPLGDVNLCDGIAGVDIVLSASGAFSLAQLTANTDVSRKGVSKHLRFWPRGRVLMDVKLGGERHWQLDAAQIDEPRRANEVNGHEQEIALGRLNAFTEAL